jgi:uncharacterized protein YbgA (DUF1722 family)
MYTADDFERALDVMKVSKKSKKEIMDFINNQKLILVDKRSWDQYEALGEALRTMYEMDELTRRMERDDQW